MSRSRRPVTGLTLVAPQRPFLPVDPRTSRRRSGCRCRPSRTPPTAGRRRCRCWRGSAADRSRTPHCSSRLRTVARLISEITLSGLSMKWPPRERTQRRRRGQVRQQRARRRPRSPRGRPRRRARPASDLPPCPRTVSRNRLDDRDAVVDLGEALVQHQHHEQALLRPFRLVADRSARRAAPARTRDQTETARPPRAPRAQRLRRSGP